MKPAHFELAENQKTWLDAAQKDKTREGARGLDSLQRFLRPEHRAATLMPERDSWPERDPDACRIVGTIPIAKVTALTQTLTICHCRRGCLHSCPNHSP
jgi:hypothetical protein